MAHDRYFLDRVVTKIIELDGGKATVYSGQLLGIQREKGADAARSKIERPI